MRYCILYPSKEPLPPQLLGWAGLSGRLTLYVIAWRFAPSSAIEQSSQMDESFLSSLLSLVPAIIDDCEADIGSEKSRDDWLKISHAS